MPARWLLMILAATARCYANASLQGEGRDWEPGSLFGASLAAVGDVDGDGTCDFVVGCPRSTSGPPGIGRAWVVSTKKGRALIEVTDGVSESLFGESVAGPGDLDGDGTPDFMVSAPRSLGSCVVRSYSGRNGALIHSIRCAENTNTWTFHRSFCGVGDLDGDGCADFVMTPAGHESETRSFRDLQFRSGRTGSVLRVATLSTGVPDVDLVLSGIGSRGGGRTSTDVLELALRQDVPDRPGVRRVVESADLDADGVPDFIVSMVEGGGRSRVIACSGKTGAVIREWRQRGAWSFGHALAVVGDVNGDGTPDILVTAPGTAAEESFAFVLSGKEDRVLQEHVAPAWMSSNYGASACGIGDVDGDGVPDYLVGEASWRAGGDRPGFVRLYSGKSGAKISCWGQGDILRER